MSTGLLGFGNSGGSTFGSGFSGGFGGGSKLSSFAAPAGDAKLGAAKAKPFGASDGSDDEDSGIENGEEHNAEGTEEPEDSSSRFQQQEGTDLAELEEDFVADISVVDTGEEGENTIFSNRGKLYCFQEGWKERGLGQFKLNVKQRSSEEDASEDTAPVEARFIMRTHATYKVILNASIFKDMSIGNGQGESPTGKAVIFSVSIGDKVTPHLLRVRKLFPTHTVYK